jgi:transcriptional regulator with XRE-family HTH domain
MRGMIAVDDVIASLPKERQKKIAARGNELLEKVQRRMTLSQISKGRKISQAKMAEVLGIGQMQISRLEKRKDPRLSTMQRTVAAMGGHLTMIATFPDQEPVVLVPSHPHGEAGPSKKETAGLKTAPFFPLSPKHNGSKRSQAQSRWVRPVCHLVV